MDYNNYANQPIDPEIQKKHEAMFNDLANEID